MIFSLDISTSCTGYCILGNDGKIVEIGSWNLKKYKDIFEKGKIVSGFISALYRKFYADISEIYIEPALMMYAPGRSNAKAISTLLKFNGIVSQQCYDVFGIKPQYIPAVSARSKCGIKIPRGKKAKIVVMEHLIKTEPDFAKRIVLTRAGNPKPHFFDEADALVIAKAGFELTKQDPSNILEE